MERKRRLSRDSNDKDKESETSLPAKRPRIEDEFASANDLLSKLAQEEELILMKAQIESELSSYQTIK